MSCCKLFLSVQGAQRLQNETLHVGSVVLVQRPFSPTIYFAYSHFCQHGCLNASASSNAPKVSLRHCYYNLVRYLNQSALRKQGYYSTHTLVSLIAPGLARQMKLGMTEQVRKSLDKMKGSLRTIFVPKNALPT